MQSKANWGWVLLFALVACQSEAGDAHDDGTSQADGGSDDPSAGDGDGSGGPAAATYAPCPDETRVGRFVVQLQDGFTQVEGQVLDGPDPVGKEVLDEAGGCRLVRLANNFCDPGCGASDTCNAQQVCVAKPIAVDVGTVTVTGLSAPVAMTPGPTNFYLNLEALPHPAFATGSAIGLSADGGTAAAFALDAVGIDAFALTQTTIVVAQDQPVTLAWDPPPDGVATGVHIELDIGHHGGSPATIECEVQDTGSFEIPASLVSQLFDFGVAGFPAIEIVRRTAASTTNDLGCVELVVSPLQVALEVTIAGVTSCSDNSACDDGQVCQADLTCA